MKVLNKQNFEYFQNFYLRDLHGSFSTASIDKLNLIDLKLRIQYTYLKYDIMLLITGINKEIKSDTANIFDVSFEYYQLLHFIPSFILLFFLLLSCP